MQAFHCSVGPVLLPTHLPAPVLHSVPRMYSQELKELIASYQGLREGGRASAICGTIIETARQCNLDRDVKLPDADAVADLSLDERDSVVGKVYSKCGLLPCSFIQLWAHEQYCCRLC